MKHNYPAANTEWVGETSLDLDMVSAICPNCHLLLVEANTASTENMVDAEDEAAALGPTEISNSFGERGSTTPDESAFDHPGTPITFSGGDRGYGGNEFAANPHVIAVGGTTLEVAGNSRGWTEKVWYHYSNSKKEFTGTGSGCSGEPKPVWQKDPGCHTRTTNDVAAVADPDTPVSVYDSYKSGGPWRLVGGTSAASPIVAASMALATPYTRSFEAAEPLYVEAAEGETGFFDVLSGSNGTCGTYLCEAVAGYDGPTGLGALDGAPPGRRTAEPRSARRRAGSDDDEPQRSDAQRKRQPPRQDRHQLLIRIWQLARARIDRPLLVDPRRRSRSDPCVRRDLGAWKPGRTTSGSSRRTNSAPASAR